MEAHRYKVAFVRALALLTFQSSSAHAARQQRTMTKLVSTAPISVPLLKKGNVAKQHGSWGQIQSLVSTATASTTPTSISTIATLRAPELQIALSAQNCCKQGPDSDCGTHIQPLCPLEETGPPGDGLMKKTLPPEADPRIKIYVQKWNFDNRTKYTFMVKPTESIHNVRLLVMIEDGRRYKDYKIENRAQLMEYKQRQKREGAAPRSDYYVYFGQVLCDDGYTLEHYGVKAEDTLNLVVFDYEKAPDGSGLKPGQGPETEPPCITRPPCQQGFNCNGKRSIRSKSRGSHLHGLSVCILISAILISFTSIR